MFAEIFEYNMLCFHLSLFNFQSAICCLFFRDLQPRRDSLTIISHLFHFVKYFFKISWSFFKFLYLPFFDSPIIISQTFGFVKGFCKSFLSFFQAVFAIQWSWLVFLFFLLPSLRQLRYYNTKYPICQPLFELFSLLNKLTNFHILPLCIFYTTGSHFLYTSPFKWVS